MRGYDPDPDELKKHTLPPEFDLDDEYDEHYDSDFLDREYIMNDENLTREKCYVCKHRHFLNGKGICAFRGCKDYDHLFVKDKPVRSSPCSRCEHELLDHTFDSCAHVWPVVNSQKGKQVCQCSGFTS